jgi:hypothetical protein
MTVVDAEYDAVTNSWSYSLLDSKGNDHGEWVAEIKLTGAHPGNRQ